MKHKKSMMDYLVVTFEELLKLEKADIYLSFSFAMDGKYIIHSNIEQCKAVLKNG